MARFEYKVVPAPTAGLKAKGVKTSQGRFANALETLMNELGAEGWDYIRADTLPCEERSGLTGRVTKYQNMLVFRRSLEEEETAEQISGLLAPPRPEDDSVSVRPTGPAPQATPAVAGDPPLHRPAEAEGDAGATSAAAARAAAAFRHVRDADARNPEPRLTRQDPARPDPGVAAE